MTDARPAATRGADRIVDAVGQLLRAGTLVVLALVVLGTVLAIAAGRRPLSDAGPAFDPAGTVSDLVALRPEGFLWLGILLTVALPAARVALAAFGFGRERDVRGVAVGLAILAILAVSVLFAIVGAGA